MLLCDYSFDNAVVNAKILETMEPKWQKRFITWGMVVAVAYFTGVLLYSIIASVNEFFNTNGVRSGMMGLLYLKVLDASFSFDGVIGSFVLSSDIFIIMIR